MTKKRSSDADFQCPLCMRQFVQAGMDMSGVCKSCAKKQAKHFASSRCWHCGADLPPGGVVCPYCKAGRNIPELVKVLGVIVVLFVVFCGVLKLIDPNLNNPGASSNQEQKAEVPELPMVKVVDADTEVSDDTIYFKNLVAEGDTVHGDLVWTGSRIIDEINYVVREDGLVKSRAKIYEPSAGWHANEPVFVYFSLGTNSNSKVEVEVQVRH